MRPTRLPRGAAAAVVAAAAALALAADPVAEVEPNAWTGTPQDLGVLGAGGLSVEAAMDPAPPPDGTEGDVDGFRFTFPDGGDAAVRFDAAPGTPVVLTLALDPDPDPLVVLASVAGVAPATLAVPGIPAGATVRVGVAAFGDGSAVPYTLAVTAEDALPPWSGQPCPGAVAEQPGDGALLDAAELGPFTTTLCGTGSLDAVGIPGGGGEVDEDGFRFTAVLPVPVRLRFATDPGQVRVSVGVVAFVGVLPFREFTFGGAAEVVLDPLTPGQQYIVRFHAEQGTPPLAYTLDLEPVAGPPPPDPEPMEIVRAVLRRPSDPARSSFDVRAIYDPDGTGQPDPGEAAIVRVRGLEQALAAGTLKVNAAGRIVGRGGPGVPGLRRFVLDPFLGKLRITGRKGSLDGLLDPTDATIAVGLDIGQFRIAAEVYGRIQGSSLRIP